MSSLRIIDRLCYTVCIVSVVVGVAIGIALIWIPGDHDNLYKALATVAVIFGGAAVTLSVNRTINRRTGLDD